MPVIIGGDYTFVTNNRGDFIRMYRSIDVHAGLLIILPAANVARQTALFNRALDAISARGHDVMNQLVEVDDQGRVAFSVYPFDAADQ